MVSAYSNGQNTFIKLINAQYFLDVDLFFNFIPVTG